MWPSLLLGGYSLLIMTASCAGGLLPGRFRVSHTRMQAVMSFVAGLMLGVALLHMLPHAATKIGSVDRVTTATLIGLLVMFFLIRMFHIHHHDTEEGPIEAEGCAGHHHEAHSHSHTCDHDHEHGHAHEHQHDHTHEPGSAHTPAIPAVTAGVRFGWLGLFLGLAVHTLIDGVALGAAVAAEADHGTTTGLLGVGTFLAVLLHKPLDALSISSLMMASGWSASRRAWVNGIFAVMCPAGAALFWFGASQFLQEHRAILGTALAFSAGVFLCISLGDLLPEVHFHSHDRGKLSIALLGGVALAYAVGFLEPHGAHDFHPAHSHGEVSAPDHEHDHDHDHGHAHEPSTDHDHDHEHTTSH